jgi:hypothetical protein
MENYLTAIQMLSDDYEQEQEELREKLLQLNEEIIQQEEQTENIDRFIGKVQKYLDLDELTPIVLNDMVKAVYVHAPDKSRDIGNSRLIFPMTCGNYFLSPCWTTCKTKKRHSRSYAVSRKHSYAVL